MAPSRGSHVLHRLILGKHEKNLAETRRPRLLIFGLKLHLVDLYQAFSSPEPKTQGELKVWDSSRRPSVHTFINISETSWPTLIKFHQKHHLGWGLAALGFGPDRIRTLVFMATDSSHRVVMG